MNFPVEEYQLRVDILRRHMSDAAIDAVIITDPISYYYFSGNRVDFNKLRPSFMLIPLDDEPVILTWAVRETFANLYKYPFPSWVKYRRFYPDTPFSLEESTDWGLRSLIEERGLDSSIIGMELGKDTRLGIPMNDVIKLRGDLPRCSFVDCGSIVWGCRMIKTGREIETIRKACNIGGKIWRKSFRELKVGTKVEDFQKILNSYYIQNEVEISSPADLIVGSNGLSGPLRSGDILLVNGGPSVSGYRMDATRRVAFGAPSEQQIREHRAAWDALNNVLSKIEVGARMSNLFHLANGELKKHGVRLFADHPAKRLGHGYGLESEPPAMNAIDNTQLEQGMCIIVQPTFISSGDDGIVMAGEQIIVTASGYEVLTKEPSWELLTVGP